MENDKASRKWQITINNPVEKGFTHEKIREKLNEFNKIIFWCMADEIGEEGTPHTHVYFHSSCVVRFSSVKKRFDGGHFEIARGTSEQNSEYVSKTGKWLESRKHETCVDGTYESWGECPIERQGKRNDIDDLYAMIKAGMTDYDILEQSPEYMLHIDKIERVRQTLRQEACKDEWRDLEVTYIYGDTGSGKTRSVMEKFGYSKVFRVTDYDHPFDNYRGQDVVIFEEYRSNFKMTDILNYLDGYPLELPCRYNNKYACYTKVYIISNLPLNQQYQQIQKENYESYRAFLRRIRVVNHYVNGIMESAKIQLLPDNFIIIPYEKVPFDVKAV